MDHKAQKVRAMKLYKKSDPFLQSLILHSLVALACSLFCAYSHLFPSSFYTIKHLLFNSIPNTWSWFVNPSCLFVVVNFIVVFLIGESRISGKQYSSSPVDHVYDEYVARTRSLRRRPSTTVQAIKKEEKIVVTMEDLKEDNANGIEDHKDVDEVLQLKEEDGDCHDEDFEECEGNDIIENEIHEEEEEKEMEEEHEEEIKEEEKEEEEEAIGIPAEELNKRVEDFIAKVNKQRWLEARFLVSSTRA